VVYTLLFIIGIYFFWNSSNDAINWLSRQAGLEGWLQKQRSEWLSFLFVMISVAMRLILLLFYFSFFKYFFLIIGSPVFAYLSEKTAAIVEGKDFPFSFRQLMLDIARGIKLALRNTLWQGVYLLALLFLSFLPVVGWISPLIAVFIESYYYGFSMLDYSLERNKISPSQSIDYISRHKGLAIGNGMMFYVMHLVPILGWVLAPAYAVIAATLSLIQLETNGSEVKSQK
jgi:CysZ protein